MSVSVPKGGATHDRLEWNPEENVGHSRGRYCDILVTAQDERRWVAAAGGSRLYGGRLSDFSRALPFLTPLDGHMLCCPHFYEN